MPEIDNSTSTSLDLAPLVLEIEKYVPLGRSGLLPALHAAQRIYGWISEPVAAQIARSLGVPLADVHGVIEFCSTMSPSASASSGSAPIKPAR
jgi:NADH:ubiquinone oxidoreductase subunit E